MPNWKHIYKVWKLARYLSRSAELLAIGTSNWQHQPIVGWYTDS